MFSNLKLSILLIPYALTLYAQPTISGTGPWGILTYDGKPSNALAYVDGMKLPAGCMTLNTQQLGGAVVTNFNTACFTNGLHQLMQLQPNMTYLGNPYVYNESITGVSGNLMTLPYMPFAQGQEVWCTTIGSCPAGISPGNGFFSNTSSTNPTNTFTATIASGTMTVNCFLSGVASACGVSSGTPVFIRNIQSTNQITGLPNCDGYYTTTSSSGNTATSFTLPVSIACNGAASNKAGEVIINPYFVQYVSSTSLSVSAACGALNQYGVCTPGSTVTLSSAGSSSMINGRIRSSYYTGNSDSNGTPGADYPTQGGPANVIQMVNIQNPVLPMEIEPPYWEYHGWAGKSGDTLASNIKNTDLSITTGCAGCTYSVVPDGGITNAISVNSTSGAITYNPQASWIGSGNIDAASAQSAWAIATITCTTCGVGVTSVTVYINNHPGSTSAAVTYPHYTRSGPIATSFTPGQSFYPTEMFNLGGNSATPVQNSIMKAANVNTFRVSWGGPNGAGPGVMPQTSCPALPPSPETIASTNNFRIDFDLATAWFQGNDNANNMTALSNILTNFQYPRQSCITSLWNHMVSTGLYMGTYNDDEFDANTSIAYLAPNLTIGGNYWTDAVVSGGTITLDFANGWNAGAVWIQAAGTGQWIQIVNANNSCLNGWYPVLTIISGSMTTNNNGACADGTYKPSGGTTIESAAQLNMNPASFGTYANISGLPSAPGADQQDWAHTYNGGGGTSKGGALTSSTALSSIVVSGSTATVNYTGHGISPGQAIRIWNATTAHLNGLFPISGVTTNSFTITWTGNSEQIAPASGTYNSSTDPNLFVTVDPNWGHNPVGQFLSLISNVANHPARTFAMLGNNITTVRAAQVHTYEYDPNNTESSYCYIGASPYGQLYGHDTSVYGTMVYADGCDIAMRAYMRKPRRTLISLGIVDGGSTVHYCKSWKFIPDCDRPNQLLWRPETVVTQMISAKMSGSAMLPIYNYQNNPNDLYNLEGMGWQAGGTGAGDGISPSISPKQWAAMARTHALLTLRQNTELQPEANKPYYGPYFRTDAHTNSTYGNELQILCGSESPYGQFSITLPTFSGGSVLKYVLNGYTLTVVQLPGNPATDRDEYCSSPGKVTTYVAQPAGVNVMDNITFAPPSPLPFGSTKFLIQTGYFPRAMQDDPVTDCTQACAISIDHHNAAAWYRVIYADSNNLPLSIGDPIQISSQGLY